MLAEWWYNQAFCKVIDPVDCIVVIDMQIRRRV